MQGPAGLLSGDRHRDDQDPRHARPVDPVGADDRAGARSRSRRTSRAPKYDPEGGQEAPGRGRLSERLRGRHGLPERPLRQRRGDLPGRRRHARARRHQGEPEGPAQGPVLRQGAEVRRLPDLVLPARLDARHLRRPQRAQRHPGLPRQPAILARRVQPRRLLQQEARRARRQGPGRERQGQARRT